MSKVRVFELAKELDVQPQDIQTECNRLGIDLGKAPHLTALSDKDAASLREAFTKGGGARATKVDETVVRRRKAGPEPVAPARAAAPVVPVAASGGAVTTSATTVRRRKAVDEAPAQDAAPASGFSPASAAAESATHELAPEPAPQPISEPAEARPARAAEPTLERAVVVTRPSRAIDLGAGPSAGRRAPEPARPTPARAEPPRAPAPVRAETAEASRPVPTPASSSGLSAPAPSAPSAPIEPAQPVATAAEPAPAPVEGEVARQSLVQVVRRVDDVIMQNLLNEAQRRAERQGGRGPREETVGPRRGPVGSPPPTRTGPRPDGARGPVPPAGPGGPSTGMGPRPGRDAGPGLRPPGAPGAPGGDRGAAGRGRVAWEKNKDKSFDDRVMRMRAKRKAGGRGAEVQDSSQPRAQKRIIKIEDTITVGELAAQLSVKASEVIKTLLLLGEMVTVNHVLDLDTVQLLSDDFDFTVENVAFDIENYIPTVESDNATWITRNPVVTVMGHVDHGKTSLLDQIRKARVAAGEAGGITQHIGAYKVPVKVNGVERHVVFLDTPGHAAFTAMRARGAQVTDVVILVVAADDGVMPQTIEAINHAKAANVPVVVALNKMDKTDAKPDRVMQQLTEYGLVAEEWGGETQYIKVSAKTGAGIDTLLESVCIQADVLDLKAIENRPAKGVVIEAELSKGRGPVATVLIQEGTLKRGDIVVAGRATGRVRAMIDDRGRNLAEAGPATPIEVLGLDLVPAASERFFVAKDEKDARLVVTHLEEKDREKRLAEERKKISLDDLFTQMQTGEVKTLNLVIKSDVQGSLEALRTAFSKLKHPEIEVRIIHDGVGAISESDVNLASASKAIIIGFNVRPEKNAKSLAENEKVDIKLYSVIYAVVEDITAAMEGMLKPNIEEKFVGRAAVREVFTINRIGAIAGCAVLQGKVMKGQRARLFRDNRIIYETRIDSLRRFKDMVNEVDRGHECGIHLENFNDVKVGDEIECFELVEIAQKLSFEI
jgi:translation initiation factor IF-2